MQIVLFLLSHIDYGDLAIVIGKWNTQRETMYYIYGLLLLWSQFSSSIGLTNQLVAS